MIKSRPISPYDASGNSNLRFTLNKSGCYIIYKNGKPVYIGYSSTNLYKTCTRHFQRWKSYQRVVTYVDKLAYNDFKVRIILCSAERAAKLEKSLIVKYRPKDNPDKLPGYKLNGWEENAFNDFDKAPTTNYSDIIVPF